jgi:hypothetical protein
MFELSDGECRCETRAELIRTRNTHDYLSSRLGAPPLSSNVHERAAEGANEADGPFSAACYKDFARNSMVRVRASAALAGWYEPRSSQLKPCPATGYTCRGSSGCAARIFA